MASKMRCAVSVLRNDRKINFLTNGTCDNITKSKKFPLSEKEEKFLADGTIGELLNVPFADMLGGHSATVGGVKCHALVVEFHFRNDRTRYMWGTPATYETKLPPRRTAFDAAMRCLAAAKRRLPEGSSILLQQRGYIDTNDRIALWLFIPFDWIVETFPEHEQYFGYLRTLFF